MIVIGASALPITMSCIIGSAASAPRTAKPPATPAAKPENSKKAVTLRLDSDNPDSNPLDVV